MFLRIIFGISFILVTSCTHTSRLPNALGDSCYRNEVKYEIGETITITRPEGLNFANLNSSSPTLMFYFRSSHERHGDDQSIITNGHDCAFSTEFKVAPNSRVNLPRGTILRIIGTPDLSVVDNNGYILTLQSDTGKKYLLVCARIPTDGGSTLPMVQDNLWYFHDWMTLNPETCPPVEEIPASDVQPPSTPPAPVAI